MSEQPDRADRLRDRVRALPWLIAGAPRGLTLLLGALLVVAGAFLLLRPLSAVRVLGVYIALSCLASGVADLLAGRATTSVDRRVRLAQAGLWIVAGLTGLLWWGRQVDLFVPAVAVILLLSGVLRLAALTRRPRDVPGALLGLAELVFAALALAWPDATLIVIGALFGGRTLAYGVILLARLFASGRRPRTRRTITLARASLAVVLLLIAGGAGLLSHQLRSGAPVTDAFYDTPDDLPGRPGVLVRTADYDGDLPAGMTGSRIYYTTTNEAGEVVPSTGLLVVPEQPSGPMPLITWSHGTVGIARHCAPSAGPGAFTASQEPAAERFADLGWAFVASDYPGMGAEGATPYLIGEGEGRAVLDAARAVRDLDLDFSDDTVVWGHSQGGHGALWAGQLAESYAPDLNVVGTAALSPASDPRALAESVLAHTDTPGASLGIAFVVAAYTDYYDDLSLPEVVPPAGRTLVREAAARCTGEGGTLVTILTGLAVAGDEPLVDEGALDGDFGRRLEANRPTGPWSAPLFIGQGEADEVIDFRINEAYEADLCAAGADLEFHGYPGGTHMSVLAVGSALTEDLIAWTRDRLDGEPSTPTCS